MTTPQHTSPLHSPGSSTLVEPLTSMGSWDVEAVRSQFPALAEGAAHFDGPGGTQTPTPVAQAVADAMTSAVANRGSRTLAEQRAEGLVLQARSAIADLLGADERGVVFGRSMTALTMDLARTLSRTWKPGDEVVVTSLDHDANVSPWVIAAERVGAVVRWAQFDPDTAELPVAAIEDQLSERTRLVAVTGASNLVGTRPDLPAIVAAAHRVGALVHVDGVHLSAHVPVDFKGLGADFYACSAYKFCGPHIGVHVADPGLWEQYSPDKLAPSPTAVPERYELGTLPYELLAGVRATVDFLASLAPGSSAATRREQILTSLTAVEHHEHELLRQLNAGLSALPGARIFSRAQRHTPTMLFDVPQMPASDVSQALALEGVNAPAGHFYAHRASERLGLGERGAVRAGIAPYSNTDDVRRLIVALQEAVAIAE